MKESGDMFDLSDFLPHFHVLNNPIGTDGFQREAVFIIPYINRSSGSQRIHVMHGGIANIEKIKRTGLYGSGLASVLSTIKDIEVTSEDDLAKQVDGYLSLLRMTKESPASVVILDNTDLFHLEELINLSLHVYKKGARKNLTKDSYRISAVEANAINKMYSPATAHGLRRLVTGTTVTAYHGAPEELLVKLGELTHPKTEPNIMAVRACY